MWQKIKNGLRSFMSGRYGSDQLSLALLIGGLILSLISGLFGTVVGLLLSYLGLAAYIWTIFRTFSRYTGEVRQ